MKLSHESESSTPIMGQPAQPAAEFWAPRKLTREAGKEEQRLYWAGKSAEERIAAAAELTRRLNQMRGVQIDGEVLDLTPRFVRRSRS